MPEPHSLPHHSVRGLRSAFDFYLSFTFCFSKLHPLILSFFFFFFFLKVLNEKQVLRCAMCNGRRSVVYQPCGCCLLCSDCAGKQSKLSTLQSRYRTLTSCRFPAMNKPSHFFVSPYGRGSRFTRLTFIFQCHSQHLYFSTKAVCLPHSLYTSHNITIAYLTTTATQSTHNTISP